MYNSKGLLVVVLAIIALLIEIFRDYTGIPIAIMDIVFFPVSILSLFFVAKDVMNPESRKLLREVKKTVLQFFSYIVGFILMFLLGSFSIYMGWQAPFQMPDEEPIHGYTLISIGFFLIGIGLLGVFKMVEEIILNKLNK